MASTISRSLARLAAGALVALLIGAVSAPREAGAGCDRHYVTSRADRNRVGSSTLFLEDLGSAGDAAADDPTSGGPAPPPAPCDGPMCNGRSPGVPIGSSAMPILDRLERWATLSACLTPPSPGISWPRTEGDAPSPISLAADIFHPPRPSL